MMSYLTAEMLLDLDVLQRAKAAGLDVIQHVHDEIVVLIRSPDDMVALQNAMAAPPWFAA